MTSTRSTLTDDAIMANPNLQGVVDLDFTGNTDDVGGSSSGYYIGGGFIITAGHNFSVNILNPAGPVHFCEQNCTE